MLDFLNEIARPALLMMASVFSIYTAWGKFGRKVLVSYSVVSEGFSSTRISNIVLQKKKDKAICTYSIHAVFENDIWLELEKFNPPQVLKSFETIGIKTSEYSATTVGSHSYSPNFFGHIEIYIETEKDLMLCQKQQKTNILKDHTKASKDTFKFGEFVFDETVSHILNYFYNEKSYVAFIHKSGYIGNEWTFGVNHLGVEASDESIKSFIIDNEIHKAFNNYVVYRVKPPFTEVAFRKSGENA